LVSCYEINETREKETETEQSLGSRTEIKEFPAQEKITIDGESYRTDDRGIPHMYYDKTDKEYPWKLIPDNKYTSCGYEYATDNQGRIRLATGKLYVPQDELREDGQHKRKPLNAKVEDMEDEDQRGHVIADVFGGSNRVDNLVAMGHLTNNLEYKALEKKFKDLVKDGHDVEVTYSLVYNLGNDTKRPDGFALYWKIDGSADDENGKYFNKVTENY